jgi:hypothetical protein
VTLKTTPHSAPKTGCPGVTEVRIITSRLYGIRVRPDLANKLKGVAGLKQGKPGSTLFCVEVSAYEASPEEALKQFKVIVAEAGLGSHFGVRADN